MKKSLLSLSIGAAIAALTLAGAANAAVSIPGTGTNAADTAPSGVPNAAHTTTATQLDLSAGGIGHIGIIPYFTTQNGNQTLFSITNTDQVNGKAVKVRFRSAANSDDIFDFTLFLSPGDVWTANISQDPTGISRLSSSDNSCTLPAQADLNRGFITDRLPASFTPDQKANWTREGYIEVLTMANVPPLYADGVARATVVGGTTTSTANRLYTTTKHQKGVATCDPTVLNGLLAGIADEKTAVDAGLDTPTTGLYTNAFIINTANALLSWSNESTAVVATNGGTAPGRGRLVFAAQTNDPVTANAVNFLTADPVLAGGVNATGGAFVPTINALEFDFPDLSTPYTGVAPLAATGAGSPAAQSARLSGSLATLSVNNDYSTLAAISSQTDFTFSQPTRRYHAAVNYVAGGTFQPVYTLPSSSVVAPAVAVSYYTPSNTSLNGGLLCAKPGSATPVTAFDRSESKLTSSNGAVVSPGTATPGLAFCGEVSVLTINNDASAPAGKGVMSAAVAVQNVFTGYQEGWINIATPGTAGTGVFAGNAGGLPVLGSSYERAVGLPVAGKSSNYSWTYKHKTVLANGL